MYCANLMWRRPTIMLIRSFFFICFGDAVFRRYGSHGFVSVYLRCSFLFSLMVARVVFL